MPEGHAVGRIDGGHAIVAPASEAIELAAGAAEHGSFTLAKVTRRVTFKASGITNAWVDAAAGCGIPNGRVTRVIDSYAGHKPIQTITAISPRLLLHRSRRKGATCHIELIPANARRLGAVRVLTDGVIRPQRFRATEVLINNRRHHSIAKGIDSISGSLLRHDGKTSAIREGVDEPVDCDLGVRAMVGAHAQS